MKTSGLALRASLVAAILASASGAFALDGFWGNLFGRGASQGEYVVDDGSFFGGEALTIGSGVGSFGATFDGFATSATNESYAGCASCAGGLDAVSAESVAFDGGIPATFDDCGDYCNPCDYCDPCAFGVVDYSYSARRPFRPVRNILSGVKNFLFGGRGYRYCQPAYVCDPCWFVCDDGWSPCETACCGSEVYAPRGCCGDGFAPGETRALDSETGLPAPGIDASVSPVPTSIQTDPAVAPQPAIPTRQYQPGVAPAPETVPTPAADPAVGAGVLQMLVPEDSVVYVNGYRTKQTGTTRSFAANHLEYGETYSFEIRVVAVRDGQLFEDVQRATLTAGESTALAFNLNRVQANQAIAVNR